jgi:NAD-dependent deacetylase
MPTQDKTCKGKETVKQSKFLFLRDHDPHIRWFSEVPFELDRIFRALDECTVFIAVGTSGVVEPAASFVAHVGGRARAVYVRAEVPANFSAFTECHWGMRASVRGQR